MPPGERMPEQVGIISPFGVTRMHQPRKGDSAVKEPVLVARGIVKSFGGIKAVQGVDISVADCSLHALIGPNGAGKTTAFNLLSGMYAPDQGSVSLMGEPIAGHAPEQIAAAGIGRSFQITNLFPALSVGENIRLAVQARHPRRFDPIALQCRLKLQPSECVDDLLGRKLDPEQARHPGQSQSECFGCVSSCARRSHAGKKLAAGGLEN